MAKGSYATKQILNWMEYFSKEMQVSPEKIKLLDICGKQKNVIPTVEGHKRVLIFADESHADLVKQQIDAYYDSVSGREGEFYRGTLRSGQV